MKKVIAILFCSLLALSSTLSVVSCFEKTYPYTTNIYDQDNKPLIINSKEEDFYNEQWNDYQSLSWWTLFLKKDDSNDLSLSYFKNKYDNLNNSEIKQMMRDRFEESDWKDFIDKYYSFVYDFNLMITNYNSIDKEVIKTLNDEILTEKYRPKNYLILNFDNSSYNSEDITLNDVYKLEIIYLTKTTDNLIIGNDTNNYFYWEEFTISKSQEIEPGYEDFFFKINLKDQWPKSRKRVVSNYSE